MIHKIIKIIKIIIFFIKSIKILIESLVIIVFPPYGWLIKVRNNFIFEYDNEKAFFIKNMPKWYSILELSWTMRILRVFMGLFLILYVNKIFYIYVQEYINFQSTFFNFLTEILLYIFILFFVFFSTLKFYLGIKYFFQLTCNSPFNFSKCVYWGFRRICNISFVSGLFGFGSSIIDLTFSKRGYVEPLDGYFQNATYKVTGRITKVMASEPSKNLELLKGDEFPGANYIRDYGQENTLKVQQTHAEIAKQQRIAEPIKRESAALIKDGKYKKN